MGAGGWVSFFCVPFFPFNGTALIQTFSDAAECVMLPSAW